MWGTEAQEADVTTSVHFKTLGGRLKQNMLHKSCKHKVSSVMGKVRDDFETKYISIYRDIYLSVH